MSFIDSLNDSLALFFDQFLDIFVHYAPLWFASACVLLFLFYLFRFLINKWGGK